MQAPPWLRDTDPWRLSARRWPVLLLLALFLGNAVAAALLNSGTCDELGAHIPSGWLYWKSGVYSGGVDNFPLGQLLVTAPAALLASDYTLWTEQHLFLFRLPGILLGLGLCFLAWRLARRLYGPGAGLAALFFAALCPNLLAHSTVATLDLPAAFFIFLAVSVLEWCVERPGPWRVLVLALALAAAALVKVQALVLYPFALLVLAVAAFARPTSGADRSSGARLPVAPGSAARGSSARPSSVRPSRGVFLLSWLSLPVAWLLLTSIVYRHAPGQGGDFLPPLVVETLRGLFTHAERGHFAYLLGKYSTTGWWYYFPVAILVKTPIAQLLLAGYGLARRQSRRELLFVTAPILLFLLPAMAGTINIGLRHVLMIYPFLAIAAGRGVVRLWNLGEPARATIPARIATVVLLATVAGHAAFITPHHLSYFNLLAGGAKNGHKVLVDSNYDWGQNDRFLREYVAKSGRPYKIDPYAFWPVNGPILVNANALHGVLNGGAEAYKWLQKFQPVRRIAWTWFEYDIPPGTFRERPEDAEAQQACLAHLFRLREAARLIPGPEFRALLGQGFARFGAYDVAFDELRQCLREHPDYAPAFALGGELLIRWKLGVLVFHGREYLDGFHTARPAVADDEDRLVALSQRAGLAPNMAFIEVQLGAVLESVHDANSARDAYRLALRLEPGNALARGALQRLGGVQ